MAAEDQGIMSLPQGAQAEAPQLTLDDSYDAVMQGLQNASPQASTDIQQLMQEILPELDELTDEDLSAMMQAIQYLYEGGEAEYAKRLQEVISADLIDAGDLPDDFDPEILSAIGTVLIQAQRERQAGNQREAAMQPPAQFARGGLAEAARIVASKGRNGDTMLAHITPQEAKLLKARGGSGTINPKTGLPEFFLKKLGRAIKRQFKKVVNAVKKVVKSPIGRILATVALATFLGPAGMGLMGGTAASAVASGAVTALGGGNLKQVLTSAATAFFGAPGGAVSNYVSQAGITNLAANAAITAGIVGTGAGVLSGQKLSEAVKSGLVAGAIGGLTTGIQQGFGAKPNIPSADATAAGPQQGAQPLGAELDDYLAKAPGATPGAPQMASAPVDVPEGMPGAPARGPLTAQQVSNQVAQGPAATQQTVPQAATDSLMGPSQASSGLGAEFRPYETTMSKVLNAGSDSMQTAKDLYNRYLSPSGIRERGTQDALASVKKQFPGVTDQQIISAPQGSVLNKAFASASPGVIGTYGPMVGAGLGIMALTGGFKPNTPEPSELAQDLMNRDKRFPTIEQDPSKYFIQNLPGVKYDEKGNIIGSTPWSPSATLNDVRVPAPGTSGNPPGGGIGIPSPVLQPPPMYTAAPGTMGLAPQIMQPYNTSAMYGNLMPFGMTQNYADGGQVENDPAYLIYGGMSPAPAPAPVAGLASLAQGGYPRRTGAISGPGTETSDSIPAMLSDGEFVMTAKAVKGLGNGSRRAGAKKMYALMHQLERNASRG